MGPDSGPPLPASILLDDVTVAGQTRKENMVEAAEAIVRLCRAGAMVGLYKGVIAAEETEFMGEYWRAGGYWRPQENKVEALLQLGEGAWASMPRS